MITAEQREKLENSSLPLISGHRVKFAEYPINGERAMYVDGLLQEYVKEETLEKLVERVEKIEKYFDSFKLEIVQQGLNEKEISERLESMVTNLIQENAAFASSLFGDK